MGENWFTFPLLYSEMVKRFSSESHFVEIGSWKGMSAAYMAVEIANSDKDIKFDCVDIWAMHEGSDIEIKGDIDFATLISKALKDIEWDYEDDLSEVIGDIPAYHLVKLGKKVLKTTKETSFNVADTFKEYWLEEKPLIAKKRLVEQFNKEVDNLRFDVDRLEQRLKKL